MPSPVANDKALVAFGSVFIFPGLNEFIWLVHLIASQFLKAYREIGQTIRIQFVRNASK
jgi:hypothetical protein